MFSLSLNGIDGLIAQTPYSGYLRAAAVMEGVGGSISVLDDHADRIPVGGSVRAEVEGDEAVMTFQWLTEGSGDRLTASPHGHTGAGHQHPHWSPGAGPQGASCGNQLALRLAVHRATDHNCCPLCPQRGMWR